MQQTLFFIPYEAFGTPIFGFGILFALWCVTILAACVVRWKKWKKMKPMDLLMDGALMLIFGAVVCFLLPRIGRAGGIPIQAYGTMMFLGIVSGVGLAIWRAKNFGFTTDQVFSTCVYLCVSGILGARAFYVIEYWEQFQMPTVSQTILCVINVPEGGLVVYGSLIGGVLGAGIYMFLKRLSFRRMLDLLAPSMMLGLALGRLGCFLNGCCFGGVCAPAHEHWGVHFPAGSPPFTRQLETGELKLDPDAFYYGMRLAEDNFPNTAPAPTVIVEVEPKSLAEREGIQPGDYILELNGLEKPSRGRVIQQLIEYTRQEGKISMRTESHEGEKEWSLTTTESPGPISLAVYPTQLYSSCGAAVIFVLLLIYSYFRRNPNGVGMRRDGEVFVMFMTLYPIHRFLMEMVRTDEANALGTQFTISQNVSIWLFTLAVISWALILKKRMNK